MDKKTSMIIALLGIVTMITVGYSNIALAQLSAGAGFSVKTPSVKLPTVTECEGNTGCHSLGGSVAGQTIGDSASIKVTP
jgi:hypothetical protein